MIPSTAINTPNLAHLLPNSWLSVRMEKASKIKIPAKNRYSMASIHSKRPLTAISIICKVLQPISSFKLPFVVELEATMTFQSSKLKLLAIHANALLLPSASKRDNNSAKDPPSANTTTEMCSPIMRVPKFDWIQATFTTMEMKKE